MTLKVSHERRALDAQFDMHLASVGLAIEALELLLIDKGFIAKDEFSARLKALIAEKVAQVQAASATETQKES